MWVLRVSSIGRSVWSRRGSAAGDVRMPRLVIACGCDFVPLIAWREGVGAVGFADFVGAEGVFEGCGHGGLGEEGSGG